MIPGDEVRVTVSVKVPPALAFQVFTEETDTWWGRGPAFRIAGRAPGILRFDPGPQGRLIERFETAAGEREHVAGRILVWDPPSRLVFEWRGVNFAAHERTEVEVTFATTPTGTLVCLTHRGFASLPPDHPVRHHQPPAEFLAGLGQWWGSLLGSLRRHAAAGARSSSSPRTATVGVSDHAGWAVLVTVAGVEIVDRRRIALVTADLPAMPYHHGAQGLPVEDGVALVERVERSADSLARLAVDALAASVPLPISAIALRGLPALPEAIADRIASTWAQNRADGVMYRVALAKAAEARGWRVAWYDARRVQDDAARALGLASLDPILARAGATLGPPWRKDHRIATAAAIAAAR